MEQLVAESLRTFFRDRSREVGFHQISFTSASPPENSEHLSRWIEEGHHGSMEWMAKNISKRTDPRQYRPGTHSLVVLTANYYSSSPHENDPTLGRISRYAWGEDYHLLLGNRLRSLADEARQRFPGLSSWSTIDTAPILEKSIAAQAGVGWVGKHSNLINRSIGSWFFLGEILLDVDLAEPTEPIPDFCGSCTRCIQMCPTGAIIKPYVVDSRLCISYLTIEHRGFIPRELRPLMGNHIYGCDDCQDVCPWNRFAHPSPLTEFQPRPGNRTPLLTELLELDEEGFRQRFRKSPIRRPKRRGFLRNVAIALGNSGDPEAIPPLIRALQDHEPLIRGHSAWALGNIGRNSVVKPLEKALQKETHPEVEEEIRLALNACSETEEDPTTFPDELNPKSPEISPHP